MYLAILIFFFAVCIAFIFFVMLQQNKGAGIETSFNSNASNVIFDSINSDSILNKTIAILAILFFLISLMLNNLNSNKILDKNEWENLSAPLKKSGKKSYQSIKQ
ncbi:preprotein translocase subunit SecG [Pantoea sp. SoEX]|uniref:preprotein translocase subunit SecG n=1 Tax=Pantoea sp. SoEX TaxID=2576763 RepID=UPI00135A306D|nr:preprotein translocase subunit SecG [Pantoea sp. SoEX]MXP51097.1 preprotein translocase subunit SecG [Pantoea sp. SoEX]